MSYVFRLKVLLLGIVILSAQERVRSVTQSKPNVIFILADDLGYRELGCYGQKKIRTPFIDQLAAEGIKLTRHYSGSPVCAPSRCVLMTGKHPGHAFIRNNHAVKPEGQLPIPSHEKTMAEYFKDNGYVTGAFGKWGLGPTRSSGDPNNQGFDRFFGYNCQAKAHTYYPESLWDNGEVIYLENNPPIPGHRGLDADTDPLDPKSYDAFKGTDYAPERINREALKFIIDNRKKPFFLYYPTVIPHVALHVPDQELRPYLDLGWEDPPFTRERGGYTPHYTPRAAYAAMISLLDKYVGRILLQLDLMGLSENTIVIFTSDNGTTHLKREVDYDFFESVGSLRGLKGSLYEGGIRVPAIVKWPGKIEPASESDVLSGFEDWIPTLMGMIGSNQSTPSQSDGINLTPYFLKQSVDPSSKRSFLYREFQGYRGQQALWMDKWKGVRVNLTARNNSDSLNLQLYDLSNDPHEKKDVSHQFPEVLERLAQIMEKEHMPSKEFPIPLLDN